MQNDQLLANSAAELKNTAEAKKVMNRVAVIGAGTMGRQIALLLALYDCQVLLVDIDQEVIDAALVKMKEEIRMIRMLAPGLSHADESCIEKIETSTTLEKTGSVELIIENIKEDEELKKGLYSELAGIIGKDTVIAVNTSCIPIASIAEMVEEPGRVIGCHFMNPVYFKVLVEVIKTPQTTQETISRLGAFLKSLKKRYVVVKDNPGFVANRLSHLLMNEAAFVINEQLCSPEELDLIFKLGYGHSMGPLETADLIGLDTVVDSLKVLEENIGGEKFKCCPLLTEMVAKGETGRKAGKGFYSYGKK
jgi:3-hydroxybutyryl-CoA dehydrogenase